MKIKWGALAVDGRGKLGGHVAADGAGGSYLRTKVTPNNPQTMAQAKARSQFGIISQKWNSLTEAQRTAWNKAVDDWKTTDVFGDIRKFSGKSLFSYVNGVLVSNALPSISMPIKKVLLPSKFGTKITVNTTTNEFLVAGFTRSPEYLYVMWCSGPVSNGVHPSESSFKKIYSWTLNSNTSLSSYATFVQFYGVPAITDNYYFVLECVGIAGNRISTGTIKALIV